MHKNRLVLSRDRWQGQLLLSVHEIGKGSAPPICTWSRGAVWMGPQNTLPLFSRQSVTGVNRKEWDWKLRGSPENTLHQAWAIALHLGERWGFGMRWLHRMTLGAERPQGTGSHRTYENKTQQVFVTLFPIFCPELTAGPEPQASPEWLRRTLLPAARLLRLRGTEPDSLVSRRPFGDSHLVLTHALS